MGGHISAIASSEYKIPLKCIALDSKGQRRPQSFFPHIKYKNHLWLAQDKGFDKYLYKKHTVTNEVNIKEADVANAAPIIPYIGINRILSNMLIVAHTTDILSLTSTFPILENVSLIERVGEYME